MLKKISLFIILIMVACSVFTVTVAQTVNAHKNEGWHLLFNGKNLKGWHTYTVSKNKLLVL